MENKIVEVQFKKWLKVLNYLGSILCTGGYFYMAWFVISNLNAPFYSQVGMFGPFFRIFNIVGSIAALAFSILWVYNTYQFKISFGTDAIQKSGAFDRKIQYEEIEKIEVQKDRIELHGNGFFNRVSIGNLYTNFEAAKEKLASKIKNEIEFEGKPKYIEKHLEKTIT